VYWLLWNCRCSLGNALLSKELAKIRNTEFFRAVFRIPAAENDKTELDLALYRLDSQNSFKEHPVVESVIIICSYDFKQGFTVPFGVLQIVKFSVTDIFTIPFSVLQNAIFFCYGHLNSICTRV
jgi:hypothetical protein